MSRPVLLSAAWVAAAAAAVGLGFLAVSFVGASASPNTAFLAATGASATGAPTSSAPSLVTTARQVTAGGTVVASCRGSAAELAGAPAAGWWTDDPAGHDSVEFANGSQKIEVKATCPNGSPAFVVEGSTVVTQRSSGVPASPTTDDKGGRHGGGGGHGSDG